MSEYGIRDYRPADREEFLSLYRDVLGGTPDPDWFEWKYEANPYADRVPITVAERDGELVGARPLFPLELSIDGSRYTGLPMADTMVHPDHRRRGLFTRMTERAVERYEDADAVVMFNFPNHRSRPGYLKLGWEAVRERPTYYRVEDPAGVAGSTSVRTGVSLAGAVLTPLAKAYYGLRDATAASTTAPSDVTVSREPTVPVDELAALYRRDVPDRIHAVRDETFYEWRFDNPQWEYATYVARRDGDPVVGVTAATSVRSGVRTTRIADVVPMDGSTRDAELAAVLPRLLEDHADSELFAALPSVLPEAVRTAFGFHPDDSTPMRYVSDVSTHVARTLTGSWEVDGRDLRNPDDWLTTFLEVDTG